MFDDNGDPPGHYDVMNFQVIVMMSNVDDDELLQGDGELQHGVCEHRVLA